MSGDFRAEWDAILGQWREVRGRRITLKKKLIAEGTAMRSIRHRKEYRSLVKEQQILSTRLRHLNALRSRRLQRERRVEMSEE
ncbi:MAG TPA: hypothetical protein PKK43_13235 [Spirochaetota bacterium]|nr:hypothetical protein [Spirochaetota bacterium]